MSASARGKKQISRFLPFLMVALAAAAAVLPLFFFKGIPFGDDLDFHLGRLTSIAECLKAAISDLESIRNISAGWATASVYFIRDFFSILSRR